VYDHDWVAWSKNEENFPRNALLLSCASVCHFNCLAYRLIHLEQVYRALLMYRSGDFETSDRTHRSSFSDGNWGLSSEQGPWMRRLRNTIKLLDEDDWKDIIEGAEKVRERSYRRKRVAAYVVDDYDSDTLQRKPDTEQYPPMKLNKRPHM
jgi:hypothetical protein